MKTIIFFCILFSPFLCLAQAAESAKPAQSNGLHDEYCMLVAQDKFLSINKVSISIDYGQDPQFISMKTKDDNVKASTYTSIVDGLNFMSQRGWSIANTYTVTLRGVSTYYYVLKRAAIPESK